MKIPSSALVHSYSPACLLRVCGSDASTFLQGQFTNDLSKVKAGGSVYGLWLDRKGRVIGDSQVMRAGDDSGYLIASIESSGAAIARHLGDHIIADEVEIADETGAWRGIVLLGEGTGPWLAGETRPGIVYRGRRDSAENWEWIYPAVESAAVESAVSGSLALGSGQMELRRIAAGIPSIPRDIGSSDLPNEGGLESEAISYSKGCYLGQEVMARIKSMGRVRRTLVGVRGTGALPVVPAGLWHAGRREGELRSAVATGGGYSGLALLSVASASERLPLALGPGSLPTVEIVRLP
jgi:folate-binding protein YgfZ